MKKLLLIAIIAFAFTACNKCQDCTCEETITQVCLDDFDSNDDYNEAIVALENLNCNCN